MVGKTEKPFPDLDGREEKTRRLRRDAIEILGGPDDYLQASRIKKSMACRAAMLEWMMESINMSVSEYTQANNALSGIYKALGA